MIRNPVCVICESPAATGHHVLSRSLGGDDISANIVAVCGSGTTGCHGKIEAGVSVVRAALGLHLKQKRPDTIEYLTGKLGEGGMEEWFHRHLHVTIGAA